MTYITFNITEETCVELTEEIKKLRKISPFFKDRLRVRIISEQTGIPMGTVGSIIRYNSLPPARYHIVKAYVDKLKTQYKNFIEPNININDESI